MFVQTPYCVCSDYGLDTENVNDIPRGPTFLVEPVETTILGATPAVYLECVAFGVPPPTYRWLKRVGQQYSYLVAVSDSRYTLTNGRLSISNPTKDDESDYYCEARNDLGLIRSRIVQLSFGGEFLCLRGQQLSFGGEFLCLRGQ